jgi:hypothetical protein
MCVFRYGLHLSSLVASCFAVNAAQLHVTVDVPVNVTAAERVTEVVVAQQRADRAARSVNILLSGRGESELPQAGPEVETHVLVA